MPPQNGAVRLVLVVQYSGAQPLYARQAWNGEGMRQGVGSGGKGEARAKQEIGTLPGLQVILTA